MKILVCGTRGTKLTESFTLEQFLKNIDLGSISVPTIIEGCCPNSPDELIEKIAKRLDWPIIHHPSTSGHYLKRNIDMVKEADIVLAFWDGFSYGTAHTIAHAVKKGIPIKIISVQK